MFRKKVLKSAYFQPAQTHLENSGGNGNGSKPRPPSSSILSLSLSFSQPPPGANGPQTAVSPGSSEPPGVARRVWWSSIPANVRPTRPQFIRHLPSPSAVENCSESSSLFFLLRLLLLLLLLWEKKGEGGKRTQPRISKVAPKG